MKILRQVKAGFGLSVGPGILALIALVSVAVGLAMRNVTDAEGSASLPVLELARGSVLQASTMSGALIALAVSAMFVENTRTANQRDLFAELEISHLRRWMVQWSVVFGALLVATVTVYIASVGIGALIDLSRGEQPSFWFGSGQSLIEAIVHGLPVMALFAAGAVCLSRLLRSGPVPTIAVGLVGIMNLLVIQHLAPSGLERAVPSAWVGQWMQLTGRDYGIAYFWTTGAFPGGRGASGWLIAGSILLLCALGIRIVRGRSLN